MSSFPPLSDFQISLIVAATAYLLGFRVRGSLNRLDLEESYAKGKADGYYEALILTEESPREYVEPGKLRRVK